MQAPHQRTQEAMSTNTAPAKAALPNEGRPGYKLTKLGWIPEEWEVVQLGEAFDFRNGYNADASAYGSGLPFVNVLDIITHPELDEKKIKGKVLIDKNALELNSVIHGDILFNRTSETPDEVGLTSVYTGTSTVTFGGFVIRGRQTNGFYDSAYLRYGLRIPQIRKEIISMGNGAVRSNIGQGDLRTVHAPLPPLPEQRRIAAVLGAWDRAIATAQELLAAQQKRKQGLMQQLLSGKKRFKGFEGEWKEVRLGEVAKKTKGAVVVASAEPHGTPVIDAGVFEGEATLYSTNTKAVRCKETDVLLLWDGSKAGRAMTGKSGIVGSTFVRLRPYPEVNPVFLSARLEHDRPKIMAVREGSGIPHVPKDFMSWYRFILPPLNEQEHIARCLRNMDAEMNLLTAQIAYLTEQKRGLMQVLLTGAVRVKTTSDKTNS